MNQEREHPQKAAGMPEDQQGLPAGQAQDNLKTADQKEQKETSGSAASNYAPAGRKRKRKRRRPNRKRSSVSGTDRSGASNTKPQGDGKKEEGIRQTARNSKKAGGQTAGMNGASSDRAGSQPGSSVSIEPMQDASAHPSFTGARENSVYGPIGNQRAVGSSEPSLAPASHSKDNDASKKKEQSVRNQPSAPNGPAVPENLHPAGQEEPSFGSKETAPLHSFFAEAEGRQKDSAENALKASGEEQNPVQNGPAPQAQTHFDDADQPVFQNAGTPESSLEASESNKEAASEAPNTAKPDAAKDKLSAQTQAPNEEPNPDQDEEHFPDDENAAGEENQERDWVEQLKALYEKHPSIWLQPWVYLLILAALFLCWLLSKMAGLGLYAFSDPAIIFSVGLLVLGTAGFFLLFVKQMVWKVLALLVCLGVVIYSILGIYNTNVIAADVQKLANPGTPISVPAAVYYFKQAPVTSVEALTGHTVGVLSKNKDINQEVLAQLKEEGVTLQTRSFDSFSSLMMALKGQAIRAVILTGTDPLLADEFTGLEDTSRQLAVLESFPTADPLYNTGPDLNPARDPFTLLISGQMEPIGDKSARSYLNLVAAINPQTHTILYVYVPRSMKLPVVCQEGLGCLPDETDKLSLASYHSILALKDTLAAALQSEIDFTMQVDLEWIINGLEAQETMDVQKLEGFGALSAAQGEVDAFNGISARRLIDALQDFSSADLAYEASQLDVMMYLLHDYMDKSRADLEAALKEMTQCISTSFSYEQLLRLIQLFVLHDYVWDTYGYGITGTETFENSAGLASKAYMLVPDADSLEEAAMDLQAVLHGDVPQYALTAEAFGSSISLEPAPAPSQPNAENASDASDASDMDTTEEAAQETEEEEEYVDPYGYDPDAFYDPYGDYNDYNDYNAGYYGDPYADFNNLYGTGAEDLYGTGNGTSYDDYYGYDPYGGYYDPYSG